MNPKVVFLSSDESGSNLMSHDEDDVKRMEVEIKVLEKLCEKHGESFKVNSI